MKRVIAVSIISLFSAVAAAQQTTTTTVETSNAAASNSTSAAQAGNYGVKQNIEFNAPDVVKYEGGYKVRNTPDLFVGGPASGPCNGFSGGLGVSGPGFAVGANTSTVDKSCVQRETARIAAMLGRKDLADAILESMEVVKDALADKQAKANKASDAQQPAPAKEATVDAQAQTQLSQTDGK